MESKKVRLWLLAIALLATAMIAAGCGSDNKKSDSSASTAAQSQSGGSSSGGSTDTGGSSGGAAADPQVQAAVDACKQQIASQPTLSASVKADLQKICQKAASGDAKQVQQATKDVCKKLVQESVPAGTARDQASAACDQATPAG
jgi:hypothetical protein